MSAAAIAPEKANPRALPGSLLALFGGLAALGVFAFVGGLAVDADTAWRAFHVNYLYFGALAQGGVIVACAFVIVGARWPGPVRRIAEGLSAWVPITLVLFLVGWLGRESIYGAWLHGAPAGKEVWLNPTRVFLMNLGILGVLALLTMAFLYHSVRPTLHGAAERSSGAARGFYERWTRGWRGDDAERERSAHRLKVLAPILCLSYALGWTFICFDQVMSLSPGWFSNLFGAYFAWGGFLSAVAATALIAILHRDQPGMEGEITRARLHDLGKMMFAFSIFWMYLFFSQYLVIWYGNLPEETGFLESRLGSQFMMDKSGFNSLFLNQTWDLAYFWERLQEPYAKLTLAAWIGVWVIPFWVLLGQRPKRTPAILGSVAVIMLLGFWIERNVLIWPSLVPDDTFSFAGLIQFGVAVGFLGAFALVFLVFSRVFPSLAVPERS